VSAITQLYRLEDIRRHNGTRPIYWVPDKLDADRLHYRGETATTGDIKTVDLTPLRRKNVIVAFRTAEEEQRADYHACRKIHEVAYSVGILRLPGLIDGSTVRTWLDSGNTFDDFLRESDKCRAYTGDNVTPKAKPRHDHGGSHDRHGTYPTADTSPPAERRWTRESLTNAVAFDAEDCRSEFLIENVLVKGEPGTIAGSTKGCKTSIAADLFISLSTGTPFLGTFRVPRKVKCAFLSGESGKPTLQRLQRRIVHAKGITIADIDAAMLYWGFQLPTLSDIGEMDELVEVLIDLGIEVLGIDPTYLCLGDVDEKSMFKVGNVLKYVGAKLVKNGITPILIHHASRQLKIGDWMELWHLAYAGFDQFLRQYLLISRKEPYEDDGEHVLNMRSGGSAGFGGRYVVNISEGMAKDSFGTRRWDVSVVNVDEAKAGNTTAEREERKKAEVRNKMSNEDETIMRAIDAGLTSQSPVNKAYLRKFTGWEATRLKEVIERLLDAQQIVVDTIKISIGKNAKRDCEIYRRPHPDDFEEVITPFDDHAEVPSLPDDTSGLPDDPDQHAGSCGSQHPRIGDVAPLLHDDHAASLDDGKNTKRKTRKSKRLPDDHKRGASA
jgi:hypothetical protein